MRARLDAWRRLFRSRGTTPVPFADHPLLEARGANSVPIDRLRVGAVMVEDAVVQGVEQHGESFRPSVDPLKDGREEQAP